MKVMQGLVAAALAAAASASPAQTIAHSTLDGSAEGWQALNGARDFRWVSDGGFIEARDGNGQELWFFSAPAAYRGDIAAAYGGTLSYSLLTSSNTQALPTPYADVQILGGNGVLLAYDGNIRPGTEWTAYQVPIVADGAWKVGSVGGTAATAAEMLGVLSDVRALRIRGDYYQAIETTALDDISLSAVPEPGAGALALAGLGVLLGLRRRRRGG